jgi:phosphotransacetylase
MRERNHFAMMVNEGDADGLVMGIQELFFSGKTYVTTSR